MDEVESCILCGTDLHSGEDQYCVDCELSTCKECDGEFLSSELNIDGLCEDCLDAAEMENCATCGNLVDDVDGDGNCDDCQEYVDTCIECQTDFPASELIDDLCEKCRENE